MQKPVLVTEFIQRDRFIGALLSQGQVWLVSGTAGWARIPFRGNPSREVVLLWSNREEALKWADVVAEQPSIHAVPLATVCGEVLPMLDGQRCLLGLDWTTDPVEFVIDPAGLLARIWRERTDRFLAAIRDTGEIWMLESASGAALYRSPAVPGRDVLPLWATREAALAAATGDWAVKRPIGVSLALFRDRYAPYLDERGWAVAPDPIGGCRSHEMLPRELLVRTFPNAILQHLRAV